MQIDGLIGGLNFLNMNERYIITLMHNDKLKNTKEGR